MIQAIDHAEYAEFSTAEDPQGISYRQMMELIVKANALTDVVQSWPEALSAAAAVS